MIFQVYIPLAFTRASSRFFDFLFSTLCDYLYVISFIRDCFLTYFTTYSIAHALSLFVSGHSRRWGWLAASPLVFPSVFHLLGH